MALITDYCYAECHLCWVSFMLSVIYAECRYAECRYAECQYAEGRGTRRQGINKISVEIFKIKTFAGAQ